MIGKQYEYDAMARCENELWWYKCLHELTLQKINKVAGKSASILDAGCGTGGLLSKLKDDGFTNLAGFDLSPEAIKYCIDRGCPNVQLLDILGSDIAYAPNSFDVIISHDILCLLDEGDDKVAYGKILSLLKPGGMLLMNLPAGQLFKGTHDHAVGIRRRYSKKMITRLIGNADVEFTTQRWPVMLSPVIFSVRFVQRARLRFRTKNDYKSDVRLPHPVLNNLFYTLTSLERKIGLTTWGSSIFITVRKRQIQ